MATIALFSGQGSQYEKMGLDLVQQDAALEEIFEVASEVLGFDLYAVIADSDAQTLAHTIYAQPAIMATSLICLEAARSVVSPMMPLPATLWANMPQWSLRACSLWRTAFGSSKLVQKPWTLRQRQPTVPCVQS